MVFRIPLPPAEFDRYVEDARRLYNKLPEPIRERERAALPDHFKERKGKVITWSRMRRIYRESDARTQRGLLNNLQAMAQSADLLLQVLEHLHKADRPTTDPSVVATFVDLRLMTEPNLLDQLENRQRMRLVEMGEIHEEATT